jgi:hydroxymethylglutaryl-CoA lyase
MAKKIKIVEVGPRDGLQNEKKILSLAARVELVEKLSDAGLEFIEVGAFVSPKWVPQMAESAELFARLQKSSKIKKDVHLPVLVPNLNGLEQALKVGAKEISIFAAASDGFSKKNINCSVEESLIRYREVTKVAKKHKLKIRAYLSTAFGCPFDGEVDPKEVVRLTLEFLKMGVYEVSIGDTIGVANPTQVENLLKLIKRKIPLNKIALHFHDTRGTALANVMSGLKMGVTTYDASVGGLGGCPYAPGAQGNLSTGDLVYMLNGMKLKTGVNLQKLIEIYRWLEPQMDHQLPGHMGRAEIPFWMR